MVQLENHTVREGWNPGRSFVGVSPQRLHLKLLLSCCSTIKFLKGARVWDCSLGALQLSWRGNQEQLWDGV